MKGIPNEPWQSGKRAPPPPELKPQHDHTLKHNPFTGRWSCKCGYVLGDGREKLLAPCPLNLLNKKQPKGKTLVEVFAEEDRKEKQQHETKRERKSKDAKHSRRGKR